MNELNNIKNLGGGQRIDSLQSLRSLAFLGIFTSHAYLNTQLGAWGYLYFLSCQGF